MTRVTAWVTSYSMCTVYIINGLKLYDTVCMTEYSSIKTLWSRLYDNIGFFIYLQRQSEGTLLNIPQAAKHYIN